MADNNRIEYNTDSEKFGSRYRWLSGDGTTEVIRTNGKEKKDGKKRDGAKREDRAWN